MLALGRTSTMPIFRQLSTAYIEFVRGVPLITVLFFFDNILPLFLPAGMDVSSLAAAVAAFALFSAAYLAENVRGGLQSIRRGQFEAADALGLTTSMRTSFIIIPQALRASIPQLVGQAIASFKETSLILIIGSLDLLLIARNAIPNQTEFLGIKKEGLLIVSVLYFIGAFAMSKYSQKLERRLGVGER
jgi:general L-amino acid transport system permease protein